jgi:hypothetical protein
MRPGSKLPAALAFFFGAISLIGCLLMMLWFVPSALDHARMQSWTETTCTVLSAKIDVDASGEDRKR